DFGLAKAESRDHTMTMAGAVLGTLDFMPPEQRQDVSLVDARSDLWSLAATLYQMVTGEPPRVIDLDEVPRELRKCIAQALKSKKDDRYQTANELRDALRGCLTPTQVIEPESVDLSSSECPKCHARNDVNRKFCNGCGDSLRIACLSCVAEIPIWEKFCGECGGNQADLLEQKIAEYQKQKQQAQGLLGEYLFSDAIRISTQLSEIEDERFVAFRDWGNSFAEELASEKERVSNEVHQSFEEAKKHRAAFDYPAAIHAMESIPGAFRSTEMQDYQAQLVSDRDESQQLLVEVKEAITKRSLEGLLPKVERGLELRGDRQDLPKLKSQLVGREQKLEKQRDELCTAAASLLERGDAKAALSKIGLVKTSRFRSSDKHLKAKLTQIVKAEQALERLVADCKADGVIEPSEVNEMLPVVFDYLEMNPNHAAIQRLQEDLISRMASDPLSHASLANFPAAVLKRLPPAQNSIGMKLKLLPSGVFTMGDESAEHEVRLTKPFMLGLHAVTQSQYERVMGKNPSRFKGANNPVEKVSWKDALKFCQKLSALPAEKAAGRVYRLPTEAEWEYACRGGTTTKFSFGDDDSELGDYAWFDGNSGKTSHPVGSKKPNAWGLYDMHGNVWEWCQDWYGDYPGRAVSDPTGPTSGSGRVFRGGSWCSTAGICRSANRYGDFPSLRYYIGFRVCLSPSGQ
ncbi:SUMF1/EgtB/PvdO family nonheme iron enzyme, partial [Rubripirellula sp.]